MNARVFLVSCALFVPSTSAMAQRTPASGEYRIGRGSVGFVHIGMSIDSVYQIYERRNTKLVDLYSEGFFMPALEIKVPGATGGQAILALIGASSCGFYVTGMLVKDSRFHTDRAVGVG